MGVLIDSVEERLKLQMGDLVFQISSLQAVISQRDKEIEDLKARLEKEATDYEQ